MLNIYGTNSNGIPTGWTTKITSILNIGEWAVYDKTNYFQAQSDLEWVIADESGVDRLSIAKNTLSSCEFHELMKGCNNLDGVTVGEGLFVGCCSLVRPGTVLGNQVYIGAGSIIDINCNIGDGVTIGDNVTVHEGCVIPANANIPSGSVVLPDND